MSKTVKKTHLSDTVIYRVTAALLIFVGVLLLLTLALAMIAGGMITAPSALLRVMGHGNIICSDLPELCMVFTGGFLIFGGFALMLHTASRICPAAAEFAYRLLFKDKR